jgi:predicted nicotinamide N-methyase
MPGYQTKQERIAIAGVDDLIIRSLLDREQFFDPDGDADRIGISSAAWPMFGLLWPSGAHLAARMALHPVSSGERILEIGCGLALASLVGHRRGADVTASDCHPLAQAFLEENLRLNELTPMKYRHGHWNAAARPAPGPPAWQGRPAPCVVRGHYDLIIGSDLLYERDANGALARFIACHASRAAQIWIIDPDRGNWPAFNRRMAANGFLEREERLDRPAAAGVAAFKGRLLVYRRAMARISSLDGTGLPAHSSSSTSSST